MTKLLQPAKRVERLEAELHEARMQLRRDLREAHESGVARANSPAVSARPGRA